MRQKNIQVLEEDSGLTFGSAKQMREALRAYERKKHPNETLKQKRSAFWRGRSGGGVNG